MMRWAGWAFVMVLMLAVCAVAGDRRQNLTDQIESGELTGNDLANAYLQRGFLFQREKQFEHALSDYNQAVAAAPRMNQAYSVRAYLLMRLGRFNDALADAAQVIVLVPASDPQGHLLLGDILAARPDTTGALSACDEALSRDRESRKGYGARGAVLAELGQEDRAMADLDRAIELFRPLPGKVTIENCQRFGAQTTPQCNGQQLDTIDVNSMLALMAVYRSRGTILFKRGDYAQAAHDFREGGYIGDAAVYAALANFAIGQCRDGNDALQANENYNKVESGSVIAAHRDFITKTPCAKEILAE